MDSSPPSADEAGSPEADDDAEGQQRQKQRRFVQGAGGAGGRVDHPSALLCSGRD